MLPRPAPPARAAAAPAARHQLYVKVVSPGDPDRISRDITLQTLNYIHGHLPLFAQMGVAVKVNSVRAKDLLDPRLVEAMKRRGILRLPALTTPSRVYLGFNEIRDVYERNAREFAAVARRGERPVEGAALEPDGELSSFYENEMSFARAAEDAQESGIGEGEDMMDQYRRMLEHRESSGRRPGRAPGAPAPAPRADQGRPPPEPADARRPLRPDNVAPRRGAAPPHDEEDAEIQATISRLSRDIDDNVRAAAFAGGGGDSLEGDEADPQDDLMESAYWQRATASDAP